LFGEQQAYSIGLVSSEQQVYSIVLSPDHNWSYSSVSAHFLSVFF
jgi:hypothetical protein